jgi:hypothetical protein
MQSDMSPTVSQKSETPARSHRKPPVPPAPGHSTAWRRGSKLRLLSREALDGRTVARKQFDAIASGIAKDLGGEDQLSTVQKHLVEAFAGCAVTLNHINAQALLGQPIDIMAYSTAVSTLVRVAAKLGLTRVAREAMTLREKLELEADDGEAD